MPFGLTNATATFQRLMALYLRDMHLKWVITYLDDIIIFSKTPKEHIQRLRGVLKPKKCEFFKSKISYLGHIYSVKGWNSVTQRKWHPGISNPNLSTKEIKSSMDSCFKEKLACIFKGVFFKIMLLLDDGTILFKSLVS